MKLVTVDIEDIRQYENNPRYNEEAVIPLEESIQQVGYLSPIIIDENNVILAGHTRYKALWNLRYSQIECVQVDGLSEEQKRKFRLLDNKTAEMADWDLDKLTDELNGLDFGDLTVFEKELSASADKLIKEHDTGEIKEDKDDELIICPRCGKPIRGLDIEGLDEPPLSYDEYEKETE